MIKTQEQNNHESKLTLARGVVAEKRMRELHWIRELKKKKEMGVSLIEGFVRAEFAFER